MYRLDLKIISIFFLMSIVQCASMNKADSEIFLRKYGYMSNDTTKDEEYKTSLKKFQETYELPMTGELDANTVKKMETARCGHPDKQEIRGRSGIWNKKRLSYKFKNYPMNSLNKHTAIKEISNAFDVWAKQVPLSFELKPEGRVDIDISFYKNGDGPGNTLAFAYFPRVGDIYFDNEDWTVRSSKGINLFLVAAHEIGHSLGLEHSRNRKALMYPYIANYSPNFKLDKDDITRIQRLYGKKASASPQICQINKVDAMLFSSKENAIYLIKDDYCWKLQKGKIQTGYPKKVTEEWEGSPSSIDAMYHYADQTYFYDNTNIWKYNHKDKNIDLYKTIPSKIDAVEAYAERLYAFKDSQYWRYDNFELVQGYPKPISSFWTGIPNSVDAVYYENTPPNKYFYFFKGNDVYKFNIEDRKMIQTLTLQEYLSC